MKPIVLSEDIFNEMITIVAMKLGVVHHIFRGLVPPQVPRGHGPAVINVSESYFKNYYPFASLF